MAVSPDFLFVVSLVSNEKEANGLDIGIDAEFEVRVASPVTPQSYHTPRLRLVVLWYDTFPVTVRFINNNILPKELRFTIDHFLFVRPCNIFSKDIPCTHFPWQGPFTRYVKLRVVHILSSFHLVTRGDLIGQGCVSLNLAISPNEVSWQPIFADELAPRFWGTLCDINYITASHRWC